MIKIGLTRTLIFEFIDENNLNDIQSIMDRSQDLYKFLKQHPNKPLPSSITYASMYQEMLVGVQMTQVKSKFRGLF